jgi:hypothetical protein
MAINASHLVFARTDGSAIPNGALHAVFPARRVGSANDYGYVVIGNSHPTLTLSAVKLWLSPGSKGAPIGIAIANQPIPYGDDFPSVDVAALTYTTPTTRAGGLSLTAPGNLAPSYKFRVAIRRGTSSGASPADPQTLRLNVGGTSPL